MSALAALLEVAGLPRPEVEFRFLPGRRFRFDLAWPLQRVAFELEGGIWKRGRHVRPRGYERDIEKYNLAQLAGWVVIRATPDQVERGLALVWLERALALRKGAPMTLTRKPLRSRLDDACDQLIARANAIRDAGRGLPLADVDYLADRVGEMDDDGRELEEYAEQCGRPNR